MARLTSAELQEAKRRKAEEKERLLRKQDERGAWLVSAKDRHAQLESVVQGLYDEVSKLSNKWPAMPVSTFTLERANKAIVAVKDLMAKENDDFVDDINEFVPAGDMPEGRDVALALRQLKDSLARFKSNYWSEW